MILHQNKWKYRNSLFQHSSKIGIGLSTADVISISLFFKANKSLAIILKSSRQALSFLCAYWQGFILKTHLNIDIPFSPNYKTEMEIPNMKSLIRVACLWELTVQNVSPDANRPEHIFPSASQVPRGKLESRSPAHTTLKVIMKNISGNTKLGTVRFKCHWWKTNAFYICHITPSCWQKQKKKE